VRGVGNGAVTCRNRALAATGGRKSIAEGRGSTGFEPVGLAAVTGGYWSVVSLLKLLLGLIWRCSQPPYETDKPTRAWATLLGLPDPAGKGARRVAAAAKALAAYDLVTITPQAGHPNLITLLQENQTAKPYEPPGDAYFRAERLEQPVERDRHVYFLVNTRLWTEGHIQSMSGAALMMLLILLAERGGEGLEVWFSTEAFPNRYHLSGKTRTIGTRELVDRQLLWVERRSLPINGGTASRRPSLPQRLPPHERRRG